tara:strand:- start:266 stop:1051 length:786 start_codon:yes stop_codon:yes gene_type:complete
MSETRLVTAAALIIGNEILSGRTHDVNLKFLGIELNKLGIQLREARVVPDDESEIIEAVNQCRKKYNYVFTTGGIGPTHDDITADCIAKAFGQKLIHHPIAEKLLRERIIKMGNEVTEARLRMARTPENAELLINEVSGAPGFKVDNVFVMAGIPRVMQAMFQASIPFLERGITMLSHTIGGYVAEGTIAIELETLQNDFRDLDIGSYPFYFGGRPGSNFVLRGPSKVRIDEAAGQLRGIIIKLGGDPIDGGVEVPVDKSD